MRHIGTLKDPHQGVAFGRLLNANGIKNQIEVVRVDDPADPSKHTYQCRVWIYDEDQLEKADFLLDQFVQDEQNHLTEETLPYERQPKAPLQKSPITTFILFLCATIFLYSALTTTPLTELPKNAIIAVPLTSAPIKRALLYDWPKAFEEIDQLEDKYGVEALLHPKDMPESGQAILKTTLSKPVWFGIYPYLEDKTLPFDSSLLFYKIRQGQVWRLISPIFLHFDIFHIFFNMMWLIYLGRMLETALRPIQYIALILISALVTNTAQYLMTGPNFLGYSGVLTAYLGFIWIRQKVAPWEAYPLSRSVITFMAIFIFGMFFLSLLSFLTEYFFQFSLAPGIANTAHVLGVFVGIFLGLLPFFAARKKPA